MRPSSRPAAPRPSVVATAAVTAAVVAFAAVSLSARARTTGEPPPLRLVAQVDLARYAGTWFEIARLPNRFQTKCAGEVTATYTPRSDGRIDVVNKCRTEDGGLQEAAGVARRVEGQPPSRLEVRFAPAILSFMPAVWGDYRIIALGPEYDYALVGTADRKYLWILSRTARMDPGRYQRLLDEAASQGFDVAKIVATRQRQPGS